MQYKTILADPPWTFRCRPLQGAVPYPTLSKAELIAIARERREGWSIWGNRVASDVALDVPELAEESS